VKCFTTAILKSACGMNTTCICADEALNAQARACVSSTSTVRETLTTLNVTNTLCGIEPEKDHSFVPIMSAFLALTCLTVILRLLARLVMGARYWWDDLCNILGMICTTAFTVIILHVLISAKGRHDGLGWDIWAVPQENLTFLFMRYYVAMVMYGVGRAFVRLSIILFYFRIFNIGNARPVMIFTFVLVNCLSAALVLTLIFQCTPVSYHWLRWDGEHQGSCINLAMFMKSTAILSVIVDFWQLVVSIPFVIRLNLSWKKKLLISIIFLVGMGIGDVVDIGMISAIEMDVGVICACLPSIQVLFKYCLPRKPHSSSTYYGRKKSTLDASGSGKASLSANRSPLSPIKIKTTIQQQKGRTESETYLPLNDLSYPGNIKNSNIDAFKSTRDDRSGRRETWENC
ncbi:unnamed protein product, partial [Clonostachys rhizophaga]